MISDPAKPPTTDTKGHDIPLPTNSLVTPLMTDLYQITMTYAHWKNKRHQDPAIFELFFRKNPFGGEYTIFCGLDECLKHIANFKFSESDIAYLKSLPGLAACEPEFFDDYLVNLNCSENVQIHAIKEGSIVFPRIPLLIVSAPLGIGQLLETTLLTLINYPSLVATNASRMVLAAMAERPNPPILESSNASTPTSTTTTTPTSSPLKLRTPVQEIPRQCHQTPQCVEFGLRRAQGPDGGFTASKYAYMGGFTGTSNVLAGKLLNLPVYGTHAHAYIQAFTSLDEVEELTLVDQKTKEPVKLLPRVLHYRKTMNHGTYMKTNDSELAAFIAYATAFPQLFLCLIDTYDTLKSGLLNFILVALVLDDLGFVPRGIRLDSGDLAYLSMECALKFAECAKDETISGGDNGSTKNRDFFHNLSIVASNDINEEVLHSLNKQNHAITMYGIGTHLVTCQAQPALGCVYKLVEIQNKPRIKLSQEIQKIIIPGKKRAYRLFGNKGYPILDLMAGENETIPEAARGILCRHPFEANKRAIVTPTKVTPLHELFFDSGKIVSKVPSLNETRQYVSEQLYCMRPDILRQTNPTPYKVSISDNLFNFLHELWQSELPIPELS